MCIRDRYLGDSNPHFVFGFTLGGSWKGIDVNAMFQGVGKQYVIRNDWMAYPFQTRTANQNPCLLYTSQRTELHSIGIFLISMPQGLVIKDFSLLVE